MPADLPPEQFNKLATLMALLHADFRRRHGLPPIASVWTLVDDLERVKTRSALNRTDVLQSPRRGFGPAIERMRRVLWKVLKPVFDRQTDVNSELIIAIEALVRDRRQSRHAYDALSRRVAELETSVASLRDRVE